MVHQLQYEENIVRSFHHNPTSRARICCRDFPTPPILAGPSRLCVKLTDSSVLAVSRWYSALCEVY